MNVQPSQPSPSRPPENKPDPGANAGAAQTGDFTQLLFLLLAPQTTVVNQNPEASTIAIAGASAATLPTAGAIATEIAMPDPAMATIATEVPMPDPAMTTIATEIPMQDPATSIMAPATIPPSEVDALPMGPVAGAPTIQTAPQELPATNLNVNGSSPNEDAVVPKAVAQPAQGEKPSQDPITLTREPAAGVQSAGGAAVPVIAEPVATAEIPADAETVLAPSAGEQTSQVLKTTDSPVGQVLGTTAARAHGIAGASAPPQSPQTATDVTTNEASAGEPATRIDVNSGSATQHPKHDLLPGQDGNGWPDGVERNPAPSDRTVQTADAFNALIARGEQDHGVAEAPPSTWRPLVDRLAEEISSHLRIGKNEAVLQLDPPELGRIKIDLRMEDGRLHARIVAEGQDSKALIEAHLPDLRQALVAGKIEVADVRISQGNWSGAGDLGQGLQQQQRGRQETGPGFDTAATGSQEGKERRPQTSPRESGRVSMWA